MYYTQKTPRISYAEIRTYFLIITASNLLYKKRATRKVARN